MGNDGIAKRVYMRKRLGSLLVDWPRRRWIDTVNDCLKKIIKGLDVRQASRRVHNRSDFVGD